MTLKDLIRANMALSDGLVEAYLGDLSDADLAMRPIEGLNPIAYQLGHLILGERMMIDKIKVGNHPALPEGFEALFPKEGAIDSAKYPTKEILLGLLKAERASTLTVLEETPESRFDEETGLPYAPKFGDLFNMVGSHVTMHAGQWVAVRRKLNKKVAF